MYRITSYPISSIPSSRDTRLSATSSRQAPKPSCRLARASDSPGSRTPAVTASIVARAAKTFVMTHGSMAITSTAVLPITCLQTHALAFRWPNLCRQPRQRRYCAPASSAFAACAWPAMQSTLESMVSVRPHISSRRLPAMKHARSMHLHDPEIRPHSHSHCVSARPGPGVPTARRRKNSTQH